MKLRKHFVFINKHILYNVNLDKHGQMNRFKGIMFLLLIIYTNYLLIFKFRFIIIVKVSDRC